MVEKARRNLHATQSPSSPRTSFRPSQTRRQRAFGCMSVRWLAAGAGGGPRTPRVGAKAACCVHESGAAAAAIAAATVTTAVTATAPARTLLSGAHCRCSPPTPTPPATFSRLASIAHCRITLALIHTVGHAGRATQERKRQLEEKTVLDEQVPQPTPHGFAREGSRPSSALDLIRTQHPSPSATAAPPLLPARRPGRRRGAQEKERIALEDLQMEARRIRCAGPRR